MSRAVSLDRVSLNSYFHRKPTVAVTVKSTSAFLETSICLAALVSSCGFTDTTYPPRVVCQLTNFKQTERLLRTLVF